MTVTVCIVAAAHVLQDAVAICYVAVAVFYRSLALSLCLSQKFCPLSAKYTGYSDASPEE